MGLAGPYIKRGEEPPLRVNIGKGKCFEAKEEEDGGLTASGRCRLRMPRSQSNRLDGFPLTAPIILPAISTKVQIER